MRLKNVLCTACAAAFAAVMFFGFNVKSFAADTCEGNFTISIIEERSTFIDENGDEIPVTAYSSQYEQTATVTSEAISYAMGWIDIDPYIERCCIDLTLFFGNMEMLPPGNHTVTISLPVNVLDDSSSVIQNGELIPYTLNGNQLTFTLDGSFAAGNYDYSSGEPVVNGYFYPITCFFAYAGNPTSSNDAYNANLESKANLINYYSGLDEGQKEPAVVELNEGDALNDGLIKAMSEAKNVVLKFTYTYEGVQYLTTVTPEAAKAAYDPEIPWYGPLFLRAHFPTVVVE